jgi:hypothetical protein
LVSSLCVARLPGALVTDRYSYNVRYRYAAGIDREIATLFTGKFRRRYLTCYTAWYVATSVEFSSN